MEENTAPAAETAAPAAEPASTPVAETQSQEQPREFEASPRNAIDRAFDNVFEDADEKPAGDRPRDEMGRFAPTKEQAAQTAQAAPAEQPTPEANKFAPPERFSADAKAAWEKAPEPIKAEVNRAITELTSGIDKYRQAYEPFRAFDDQLRANGQRFDEVIAHYTGIEHLLSQDPVQGLDRICRNMGMSLEDVARHVLGQPQEERAGRDAQIIAELNQKLQRLEQGFNGINQAEQERRFESSMQQVVNFAATHPRVDELAGDIKFFLESGRATDLEHAYALAERLNPAPAPQPSTVQQQTPAAQNRRGVASVAGAPTSGSNPANRKTSGSVRSALDNAFDSIGI
jgi:DNA-binding transcriptional MerR regulator